MAMGSQEQSFLGGALSGAAAGSVGGVWGAAAGFAVGGLVGLLGQDAAEDAERERRRRMDEARTQAVMREFGIMQQKTNRLVANRGRRPSSSGENTQGDVSATEALNESGFIGQAVINTGSTTPASSSGTF